MDPSLNLVDLLGNSSPAAGLHLLLDLSGPLNTESMLEDLSDILKSHALDLRVAEVDANPAKTTDCGIEAKGSRGSSVFHLSQESGRNNDVGTPAGHSQHHGTHSTNFHGEELAAEPGGVTNTRRVEADVEDHADKHNICGPADLCVLGEGKIVLDGDPLETDSGNDQEETHELHSAEQDSATSGSVDKHEVDPGEDEVGGSNNGSYSDGVGEADEREDQRRVVHERVETAELRDSHETTSRDESAEVGWDDVKLLENPPLRLAAVEELGLLDVPGNVLDLVLDLLFGTVGEDLSDNHGSFFGLVVEDELARRLGAEGEKASEDNGRNSTAANHVSPSAIDMGKSSTDAVTDELTASDAHVIETNHATTVFGRRDFCDVPFWVLASISVVSGKASRAERTYMGIIIAAEPTPKPTTRRPTVIWAMENEAA